jgi:hypothetical protein
VEQLGELKQVILHPQLLLEALVAQETAVLVELVLLAVKLLLEQAVVEQDIFLQGMMQLAPLVATEA